MRVSFLGTAALALSLLALAQPARADAYDATLARAVAAKERALDTNDPASWEDALSLFQQADRIRSTKETKYEIGSAAARLRQDDLAIEAFESALALGLEGSAREKAQAFVAEKAPQMARLEVIGPEGAELWVGTRARGTLPLGRPIVVFAGTARLRIVHEKRERTRELQLSAGAQERVDLSQAFAEEPPATPPPRQIETPPPVERAPPRVEPQTIEHDKTLGWVLLIGGSAAAVIGGAFVIGSSATIETRRDRLAELCAVPSGSDACATAQPGQREAAQSEVDAIATWKAVRVGGWVGLGLGVAAAGTGLVLVIDRSEPRRPARLGLSPLAGGAALSVTGPL